MRKEYLEIGRITGTHGIRGEMRFEAWCDDAAFLKSFKNLYFKADETGRVKVLSCRQHGNVMLLSLEGIYSVEDAAANRNKTLYIKRADAKVKKDDWFIEELIGSEVIDVDDNTVSYGVISNVSQTGANDVWHIKKDDKEVLIPAIKEVVKKVDIDNEKVYIRPLRGLFDDI
ncbi:MAG: Ribosome maturation factor RimM [Firmicutes bacterium ADurb.Bin300]|jgi:16S rRNA processing protein RimM|nr:MAG: Ribosome maturation factor RimM [Firmicutes bacterium ADurb.Bin300]